MAAQSQREVQDEDGDVGCPKMVADSLGEPIKNVHKLLDTTPFLEEHGYYIYAKRFLFCMECVGFLTPQEAAEHYPSSHAKKIGQKQNKESFKEKLTQVLWGLSKRFHLVDEKLELLNHLQKDPSDPKKQKHIPLSFMKIKEGVRCPICSLCYISKQSCGNHMSVQHPDQFRPKPKPQPASYQTPWLRIQDTGLSASMEVNPALAEGEEQEELPSFTCLPWFNKPTEMENSTLREREEKAVFKTLGFTPRVDNIPIKRVISSMQSSKKDWLRVALRRIAFQYILSSQKEIKEIALKNPDFLCEVRGFPRYVNFSKYNG